MKRPLIDMIERQMLLLFPNSGYSQRMRFYLAQKNFERAFSKSIIGKLLKKVVERLNEGIRPKAIKP